MNRPSAARYVAGALLIQPGMMPPGSYAAFPGPGTDPPCFSDENRWNSLSRTQYRPSSAPSGKSDAGIVSRDVPEMRSRLIPPQS